MSKNDKHQKQFEGNWWIPRQKQRKCHGKLIISTSEIRLELNGLIVDKNTIGNYQHFGAEIILGELFNGDKITISNCNFLYASIGKISKSSYTAKNVFTNVHFSNINKIFFKTIKVHFWYLREWYDNYKINLKPFVPTNKITAKYKDPKKITVKINSELKITLITEIIDKSISFPIKDFEINPSTYFILQYTKRKTINEIQKDIERLENFLTLMVGETSHAQFIIGKHLRFNRQRLFDRKDIDIYSKLSTLEKKEIKEHDCLMSYSKIRNRFTGILKKWWNVSEEIEPVIKLYFDLMKYPTISKEVRFLYTAQAIESYHRIKLQKKKQTKTEKKRRDQILNSLSKNNRIWLSQRFPRDEPILHSRLTAILKKIEPIIGIPTKKQADLFVKRFKDTRNYLTHYDETGKKHVLKNNALEIFSFKTQFILQLILLYELKFTSKKIKTCTKMHRPSIWLLHRFF